MEKTHQKAYGPSGETEIAWLKKYFTNYSYLKVILFILAFFALGILVYSNTFESPFVFDDKLRITDNPDIRIDKLTINNLWNAAFGQKSARSRPVGNISFALNYYFHQYELAGYHLINIIIHIFAGILLWLLFKKTLSLKSVQPEFEHGEWIALFAALLWLVSPTQTQSVTYIVQRLNSLAAMLFLLSFWLYLNGRLTTKKRMQWIWFIGAALAWFLALGCKQNTATLPFFIILYEWYFIQDLNADWLKRNIKYLVIIFVVFVLISFIFLGANPLQRLASIGDYANKEFTLLERVMTEWRVVIYYLSLIILPHPSRLNLDYDFPLSYSLIDPITTLLSLIAIIGLIILAVFLAKKQRLMSFCIFWFLGNLVIESSVIPIAIIFEHRIYLPSMLVYLIPVILFYQYFRSKWLVTVISCALVILFSYWTFERNSVWESSLTLWADNVMKSPKKARPYSNLGVAQKEQGMVDEAYQSIRKALQLNPNYVDAHHNIGVILEEQNEMNIAIEHYRKAIELNPAYVKSYNNLGRALLEDNTDEAIRYLIKALQIDPNYAQAHNNLGLALSKQGKNSEAIEHYVKALSLDPDNARAHLNLGDALQMQGKTEQAINHYHKALQTDPDYAEAYNNLGGQLLKKGKMDQALENFSRALMINPDLAQAHNNVGIILIQQGSHQSAISHFQEAIRIDPDFKLAENNLNRALAMHDSRGLEANTILKSMENSPDDPVLHFKLGNLYLSKGKLKDAIIELEKAVSLQPQYLAAQNNLAMAYAADRQYDQALVAFKNLIELDPANAGAYYNVSVLYALQNNVQNSIDWLKQAIDQGYHNWELIKSDKDLANIRNSEDYKNLIKGH